MKTTKKARRTKAQPFPEVIYLERKLTGTGEPSYLNAGETAEGFMYPDDSEKVLAIYKFDRTVNVKKHITVEEA